MSRPACPPPLQRLPTARPAAAVLAVALTLGVCAPAAADDLDDVQHTVLARQALLEDPALATLHFGVQVRDRVATLWGPVPSAQVAKRAVILLRQLPDLIEVRDRTHLDRNRDPFSLPPPIVPEKPPVLPKNGSPGQKGTEHGPQSFLARRTNPDREAALPVTTSQDRASDRGGAWVPVREPDAPAPVILPAIKLPGPSLTANPSAVKPQRAAPPAATTALADEVQRLKTADARYRLLQVRVQGNLVTLSGVAQRWSDVYELSEAICRLPGVERVLLHSVRVEPQR